MQEHSSKGLSANEWVAQVAGAVGGKAGGKGSTSVGSGGDVGKINEGVGVAIEHLEKLRLH
jgi:alanyl-tRNA synthetase